MSKPMLLSFRRGLPLVLGLLLGSSVLALSQEGARRMRSGVAQPQEGKHYISLTSYADPWSQAQHRWWDIASSQITKPKGKKVDVYNQYNGWQYTPVRDSWNSVLGYTSSDFSYARAGTSGGPTVLLTYDKAPNVPYFVGHIEARNLKPNFAYQMKLVGKPRYGKRGLGPFTQKTTWGDVISVPNGGGEDWANSQLGHIGRWWNDSNASGNTNAVTDSVYAYTYPTDTIYGYIFMGDFVTGADGSASIDFTGQNNYHITFQDWQEGHDVRVVQNGTPAQLTDRKGIKYFPIIGSPRKGPSYGYGKVQPSTKNKEKNGVKNVYLWYQYESSMTWGRPRTVQLPPGRYRCRLMLTEESFHNNHGATNSAYGGKWKSVLITEDFAKGPDGKTLYNTDGYAAPDTDSSNDIVFDIRDSDGNFVAPPLAPSDLNATWSQGDSGVSLSWQHGAYPDSNLYFNIKRSETPNGTYSIIAGGVDTSETNYIDTTASAGKSYFYAVSAVKSGVEGPDSTPVSVALPAQRNSSATRSNARFVQRR